MHDLSRPHPVDERCEGEMLAILRAQPASARLSTLDAMWRSAVSLVRCGIAAQHPEWPEGKIAAETARRIACRSLSDGRD